MAFIIVATFLSVLVCISLGLFATKMMRWHFCWKFWFVTCAMVPIGLIAVGLWVFVSFEPPAMRFGDPEPYPDPGPLNALVSATLVLVLPTIYLCFAVPVAFLLKRFVHK
jgi:hypothetical protein